MNEMSEMAAVIKAEAEFFSVAGKATKQMLQLIRNFMKLMFKDIGYDYMYKRKYLGNKSGKTRKGNLNKISREWQFVKLPNNEAAIKQFNKYCRKMGIPYTQIKGVNKLMPDGETNYIHVAYPAADAVRMKAVMQMFEEFWMKYNKHLQSNTDIAEENVEDVPEICIQAETFENCATALGCSCSCKEFDAAFTEQYPEAAKEIDRLSKTIPDIEKKREVVIEAVKKNKRLPERLSGYGVMKFAQKQIIGGKIIGNELFVQFVSPFDPTKAVELPLKNMINDSSGGVTVYMPKDDLVTIYNINGEDNRVQYYMSDIIEATKTGKTITPYGAEEQIKEQISYESEHMQPEPEMQYENVKEAPTTDNKFMDVEVKDDFEMDAEVEEEFEAEYTEEPIEREVSEYKEKTYKVPVDIPDDMITITINDRLVEEETPEYYHTRIPYVADEYLYIRKERVKIVDDGKTYMYTLNSNEKYTIHNKAGTALYTISGKELYQYHYLFDKDRKYYETKSKTDTYQDKKSRKNKNWPKGRADR